MLAEEGGHRTDHEPSRFGRPQAGPGTPAEHDYRPTRTGAQTGAMLVASGLIAFLGVFVLAAAVYSRFADVRFFGGIANLLLFSIALLLLATFLLVWDIVMRLASRPN